MSKFSWTAIAMASLVVGCGGVTDVDGDGTHPDPIEQVTAFVPGDTVVAEAAQGNIQFNLTGSAVSNLPDAQLSFAWLVDAKQTLSGQSAPVTISAGVHQACLTVTDLKYKVSSTAKCFNVRVVPRILVKVIVIGQQGTAQGLKVSVKSPWDSTQGFIGADSVAYLSSLAAYSPELTLTVTGNAQFYGASGKAQTTDVLSNGQAVFRIAPRTQWHVLRGQYAGQNLPFDINFACTPTQSSGGLNSLLNCDLPGAIDSNLLPLPLVFTSDFTADEMAATWLVLNQREAITGRRYYQPQAYANQDSTKAVVVHFDPTKPEDYVVRTGHPVATRLGRFLRGVGTGCAVYVRRKSDLTSGMFLHMLGHCEGKGHVDDPSSINCVYCKLPKQVTAVDVVYSEVLEESELLHARYDDSFGLQEMYKAPH